MTSINIPNSVTDIASEAFSYCDNLSSVIIPPSVTSLSLFAFRDSPVKKIAYPSGLSKPNASTLIAYDPVGAIIEDGFVYGPEKKAIYFAPLTLKGEYSIPSSVSQISENAFAHCEELTKVNFHNSVTYIGRGAFMDCSGLTSMTVPNSVTTIGQYAFSNCKGLTKVELPSSLTLINNGLFLSCSGLISVDLPNSVEYIRDAAFNYCSGLTSLTVPNSVKEISGDAFSNCSGLKSVNILGRTICNSDAFKKVYNVESLKINKYSSGCSLVARFITVKNQQTTQRTGSFTITKNEGFKVIDDNGKEVTPEAEFNWEKLILNSTNDKIFEFSDLQADVEYTIMAYGVRLAALKTKPVLFNGEISSQFADKAIVTASFDSGDCEIENIRWKFGDNLKYEGRTAEIYYSGLNDMGVICEAEYNGGVLFYDLDFHFPEVTVTNKSAQATSLTSCRLSADINFSDGSVAYIEWRRNDAPDNVPSQVVECPVVGQKMLGELRGLRDDVYYQFRPYVERGDEKHYGEWTGFYTGDANVYFAPEVNTMAARVEGKSVMMAGYVLQGTDPVTSRGFELKSLGNITRAGGEWVRYESTGTLMYVTLDDLAPGTDYVYRVYADTQKGTSYGDEMSFSTPALSAIEEIENNEKENSLNVSLLRNPVEQAPVVKVMASAPEAQIAIVSTDGRTCYQGVVMTDGHPQTIDVNLQPGMYLVVVASRNERKTIRMIVR